MGLPRAVGKTECVGTKGLKIMAKLQMGFTAGLLTTMEPRQVVHFAPWGPWFPTEVGGRAGLGQHSTGDTKNGKMRSLCSGHEGCDMGEQGATITLRCLGKASSCDKYQVLGQDAAHGILTAHGDGASEATLVRQHRSVWL